MSTLEQQEVNVQSEQPISNEGFVEDIVNEQSVSEEAVVPQEEVQETISSVDYEAEAKKFQSMYDRSQAENARLQQGAQILQLLEQRPDLVQALETGMANPPSQQQSGPEVTADDFNPWDAFTNDSSESSKYVNQKINSTVEQIVSERLAQQQQQMQSQMQMQNTVNELRGTYRMSDNDIQDFLQFTTKPKEQVGLNNLVKLWQMQNGQSVANNDTMEAVNAAKQAPRTAGVLQGQSPNTPKNDADKVFDSIMGTGAGSALP
tara:strand:+ start:3368 stop:4153 length:786 start_codon:yes stop_codon:yes gene_type:complete